MLDFNQYVEIRNKKKKRIQQNKKKDYWKL